MGQKANSLMGEIHSIKGQSQETRRGSNKPSNFTLKEIEKEQTKTKMNKRKELIKIRAEINEIESKKRIQKINESKSWFFEKINKIDKPLTRYIKNERERILINKMRNERRNNNWHEKKYKGL